MSTTSTKNEHFQDHLMEHHHKENFFTKYIFTMDHKMIGKQFLITGMIMGIVGVMMSMLFRLELAYPEQSFPILEFFLGKWAPDGVMDPNMYLALVTIHGTIMVFFVLTAGLSGTFSNLLIPLQIGARDMASGFMNALSYWFFFLSSVVMIASLFVESGPASGGWTVYPPLSALPQAMPGSGTGMTLWLISMTLFIVGSLLGSLNYIVTVVNMRTKGMSMTRLPLTIWAFFVTAILGVLSFPVLLSAALLLMFDRLLGTSFYLSDIFIEGVGAGKVLSASFNNAISGGAAFNSTFCLQLSGSNFAQTSVSMSLNPSSPNYILKALGTANWSVRKVFLYNASYLIGLGLFWGNSIGLGLLFAQKYLKLFPLNPDTYYVSEAPVYISWDYILILNIGTFVVCLLMLLIPSVIISKISPVKAIRFD